MAISVSGVSDCVSAAWADGRFTNPDIGPTTFELLPYQGSGYRFKIIGRDEQPPSGFERSDFDPIGFESGEAGFGSGGDCQLQQTRKTTWTINSQLLVRRAILIPEGATNIRMMVVADNDIVGVFFNGARISGIETQEGCPIKDEFRIDVPQFLVQPGENIVAFNVVDRGTESFFDLRILAERSPRVQEALDKAIGLLKTN